ncbi:MAG: type II secretion system protein [Halobacteriales archaeon]|nr:type II secretion system protein [Halobacteriales archaeon]
MTPSTLLRLAALSPRSFESDPALSDSLCLLGVDWDSETWRRAGDGVVALVIGFGLLATAFTPSPSRPLALVVTLILAATVIEATVRIPALLAAVVRRRAFGGAPWLICRAAMRLRVTPTLEAAAAVAATKSTTPLDRAVAVSVRRGRVTGTAGFDDFLDRWGEFPPLRRGIRLLTAASRTGDDDRPAAIDRALDAVLDGVRETAADDAAGLRGPVTAVYAFGVLLPLAFVAALPAAGVAGLPISLSIVVLIYDIVLPVGLLAAGLWLTTKRPVTFPPTRIRATHPEVPDTPWRALTAGGAVACCAVVAAPVVLPAWAPSLASIGLGFGTVLVVHYRPYRQLRAETDEIDAGLPDLLYGVGRRVRDGDPVEQAVDATADTLESPASTVFTRANRRGVTLGVGIERALCGEQSQLATVPSRRVDDVARLFVAAARVGRPAGPSLVAAGEHLGALARVEEETRRSIRHATGTMGNTAALFGPLVGGVTVALAGRVGGSALGKAIPQSGLALAVGVYVLLLAVLLTALATGLERGFERSVVGYRVGLALLAATATYLTAVVAGGLLV